MEYRAKFLSALNQIDPETWDSIALNATPFMRHAFLNAFETSGCVNTKTGWQPFHMMITRGTETVALLPLYIKHHSYGEYVFDFEWAKAYQHYGMSYYPKLLSAVPFTPVTGPRLAVAATESPSSVYAFVVDQIRTLCQTKGYSSWHGLFTPTCEAAWWKASGVIKRCGVQFHWTNNGYHSFEHYLSSMTSKRRKTIKRERRRIEEQGITHRWVEASHLSPSEWSDFYDCYAITYLKRNQAPYLNLNFFKTIAETLPQQVLCLMAEQNGETIASALFLIDESTLYGRYWGSKVEEQWLHFETCYYQGIEYAINCGLKHFDAGAQGEHKISRGFAPTQTISWHWIEDSGFREAISRFVIQEATLMREYQADCEKSLPFKEASEK